MATTTVFYSSQGRVGKTSGGTPSDAWDTVRGTNTTTGNTVASTGANENFGAAMVAARGGSVFASNKRAYFYFNLSGITTTITAITLTVRGGTNTLNQNGDWIVARANQDNDFGTIATSDYALVFNSSTSFTSYSLSQTGNWSVNSNNSILLNATAVSNANSEGELCVCLMNYTYDYANGEVEENFGSIENTLSFANSGTNRANLVVTHAAAGYGNIVNEVAVASIGSVNEVTTANIEQINEV
tara:strand:+ start:104 stop:832 length:729 start_codon:yes stop_codon:yes gene_type:complete